MKISAHEYARAMAIKGHLSLDNESARGDALIKACINTITTMRRFTAVQLGEDRAIEEVLTPARDDASRMLEALGVDDERKGL